MIHERSSGYFKRSIYGPTIDQPIVAKLQNYKWNDFLSAHFLSAQ